jgi:hypothetical protein
MNKTLRWALIVVGVLVLAACAFFPWLYPSAQLRAARAQGCIRRRKRGCAPYWKQTIDPAQRSRSCMQAPIIGMEAGPASGM